MAYISSATQTATRELHLPDNDQAKPCPPTSPAHSGRLRYANPEDLPSFPSLGLRKGDAAAGAAASLGWANQKPVILWTPENSASAHKAANLAQDVEMPSALEPVRNTSGPKTAAMLATGSPSRPDKTSSGSESAWGNSAANQAFANSSSRNPSLEPHSMTKLDRQKSLRAAKGAMAGDGRPRSISSPLAYPDSSNAAANALNAATVAHRPSVKVKAKDAGSSPITKMDRQMYTSNPPVKAEVDERNREAVLHASALAMAKKIYSSQRKLYDTAQQTQAQDGSRSESPDSDVVRPMQFTNLQEAAYKLAQERLARLYDEHQKNRDYQDYYVAAPSPAAPGKKLTRLGQARQRAASDGDTMNPPSEDDQRRSRQIRKQMSLFSTNLSAVDEAKRSQDREALLAAAQRNVKATLDGMDKKMYRDTGRVSASKLNDWEYRAHETAQARSEARNGGNVSGKIDLGGGMYMDQSEVDEIAAREVQPILDEINERAEREREEQEKKRLEVEAEKQRNAEIKENNRKLKEEEKVRKEELKHEAKARKEEEKTAKAVEKRLAKEDKAWETINDSVFDTPDESTEEPTEHRRSRLLSFPHLHTKDNATANNAKTDPVPLSPSSNTTHESAGTDGHTSKVRNWLKSRLHRPRAKSISFSSKSSTGGKSEKAPAGGFVGGHRLTGLHPDGTGSLTSLSEHRSASMADVALVGTKSTATTAPLAQDEPGESSTAAAAAAAAAAPAVWVEVEPNVQQLDVVQYCDHHDARGASSDYGEDGSAVRDAMNRIRVPPPASLDASSRDSKFIEIIE